MPLPKTLIQALGEHLAHAQKSERWAMYRLIVPIVDFANSTLKLTPYFEFNQTSAHGTSQSVDIALLYGDTPVSMIEAKRVDRSIGADQIDKYLVEDVRGIVSNGVNWILCLNGQSKALCIWDEETQKVNEEDVEEIVDFLFGSKPLSADWSRNREYIAAPIKPIKPKKPIKALRRSNPKCVAVKAGQCLIEVRNLSKATELELAFLEALVRSVSDHHGDIPSRSRFEFRSSRVSFFDESQSTPTKRTGRIELGKRHPDILVLTEIVNASPSLSKIAPPAPHDKGPHMRRFRLPDESSAMAFGIALGKVIFNG